MPITTRIPVRRLTQNEFGEIAFEVMRHVFGIHNEIGCYFDERIYKRGLACRLPDVRLEEPVDITFGTFHKQYFLDVLVSGGALFEFKAVDILTEKHRAQLLNYLVLCDLAHGKLINLRANDVKHAFVNTHWRYTDRLKFEVDCERWDKSIPGADLLCDHLVAVLRDLGVGLEIGLYEEAVVHFFGGQEFVEQDVAVELGGQWVGMQRMRLIAPGVAFKVTGFDRNLDYFESNARRLLVHADLRAIAWININMKRVTFTTLSK